jgi:hypothetical protein
VYDYDDYDDDDDNALGPEVALLKFCQYCGL